MTRPPRSRRRPAKNVEMRLMARVIQDGNIVALIERGVDASWWQTGSAGLLWRFARRHYAECGGCPSVATVEAEMAWNSIPSLGVEESLQHLLNSFAEEHTRNQMKQIMRDGNDPEAIGAADDAFDESRERMAYLEKQDSLSPEERDVPTQDEAALANLELTLAKLDSIS